MKLKLFLIGLFLLGNLSIYGQNSAIKEDLRNPQSTFYVFMHYTSEESEDLFKAASTLHGVRGEESRELARKLRKIIDAKGYRANVPEIPSDPKYQH